MRIILIAAVAENGVIGRDNAMPWRLKSDLQRFRALTTGKPIVMGRKTYASLSRPLKGRTNIVISGDLQFCAPGIVAVRSIEGALDVARGDALRRGVNEVMVVGGSRVYAAFLPRAAELQITRVHAAPEGDVFFPAIDPSVWQQVASSEPDRTADDSLPFTWITYRRVAPAGPPN